MCLGSHCFLHCTSLTVDSQSRPVTLLRSQPDLSPCRSRRTAHLPYSDPSLISQPTDPQSRPITTLRSQPAPLTLQTPQIHCLLGGYVSTPTPLPSRNVFYLPAYVLLFLFISLVSSKYDVRLGAETFSILSAVLRSTGIGVHLYL